MTGTAVADPPAASADTVGPDAPAHSPVAGEQHVGRIRWRLRSRDRDTRPHATPRSPVRAAWTTRIAQAGLWTLVSAGGLAGAAALTLQLASPDPPDEVTEHGPSAAVEGFAELYVAAFLSEAGEGTEEALGSFYAEPVTLSDVEPGSLWVHQVAAVTVEAQPDGQWAVTVAVEALLADEQGNWQAAGRRYYRAGIAETPTGLTATSLPARVAAPAGPEHTPERVAGAFSAAVTDGEPLRAAARFLSAYLAGEGEADRYTAPTVVVEPLDPPAYVEVEVRRVASRVRDDRRVLLGVEAAATEGNGRVEVLHYWLDVVERDGRWEVARVYPAAPLSVTTP